MSESREHTLTDETPCIGCPNLQRVSAIENSPKVHIHCNGECPEVEPQVKP
jgi:hypothetical protein